MFFKDLTKNNFVLSSNKNVLDFLNKVEFVVIEKYKILWIEFNPKEKQFNNKNIKFISHLN